MKKAFKLVVLLMLLFSVVSFGKNKKTTLRYNDIRVTFVTTQGSVSFYLYPEAAPITVANFINLGKRGFYNDNKIHRAVENFVVQAGDPSGTGRGGPGYSVPDEIVNWLDFFQQGMLAMANAGPNTGGSQYFMTLFPAEWLNGRHTVFGEVEGEGDLEILRKLEYGDIIKEVKFTPNADAFLSIYKDKVDVWNKIIDEQYPNRYKKYPVRAATSSNIAVYNNEVKNIYEKKSKDKKEKEFFIPKAIRKIEKGLSKDKKEEE
ncbi:MAG: peptidylprolyl isomerase [Fusobacteriaceae bacterium]|jgi:cyclophilin family peptidyl-prolyl cis-trans isomerase|nr:peptidylprolyl isomerase [Fusobacteriaceae bacterium]